jgi:predicted NBD/HSP70 family sugar kinase
MNILTIDIGGTNVKFLATGQEERRRFPSGRSLTPQQMVDGVRAQTGDWPYEVVSIGYPGRIREGRIIREPNNLGPGWLGFDFEAALGCPVKLINDAAVQALGSYEGGELLFLGLGTGIGAAVVAEGVVVPLELGQLSYRKATYADYLGNAALKRLGRKQWQRHVEFGVARLIDALYPDDVVLGGGNAKKLIRLPKGCRLGSNANAFVGGFRLWDESEGIGAFPSSSSSSSRSSESHRKRTRTSTMKEQLNA